MNEPGRELDELIAVQVMGAECIHVRVVKPTEVVAAEIAKAWEEEHGQPCPPSHAASEAEWAQEHCDYPEKWCAKCHAPANSGLMDAWRVPSYSSDIAQAWRVVEKMRENGWFVTLVDCGGFGWRCEMSIHDPEGSESINEKADTMPLAVCRAAYQSTVDVFDGDAETRSESERRPPKPRPHPRTASGRIMSHQRVQGTPKCSTSGGE